MARMQRQECKSIINLKIVSNYFQVAIDKLTSIIIYMCIFSIDLILEKKKLK